MVGYDMIELDKDYEPFKKGNVWADRIRELELARQREARESLDYLTGLPMRHKGEALILEKMQKQGGCLGFVDMDNLKKINDVYGHKAGDRALRLVGEVLTECMENAVVCRLEGDEFLFYLPEVSEAEINMRVRKLFDSFRAAKKCCGGDFSGIPVLRSVHVQTGRQL